MQSGICVGAAPEIEHNGVAQKITVSPSAGTRNSSAPTPAFSHSFLRSSGGSSTGSEVRTHVLDVHLAGAQSRG
jgi:hypothetical protein